MKIFDRFIDFTILFIFFVLLKQSGRMDYVIIGGLVTLILKTSDILAKLEGEK